MVPKGSKFSKITKQKMSESHLGHLVSQETRNKISNANTGKNKPLGFRNVGMFGNRPAWNKGLVKEQSHLFGKPNCNKGKKWTDEQKYKLKNRIPWNKGLTLPPDMNGKIIRSSSKKPNYMESKLFETINKLFNFEYEYVGNFRVFLDGRNPDFININGKKKIIEFFGRRWHKDEDEQDRKNCYKKFGYDTLVIWSEELKDINKLETKLLNFNDKEVV